MAKIQNGNLRMTIQIGGFLVLLSTIIFAAGGVKPSIKKNADNIALHYVDGCKPSVPLREDISALKTSSNNTAIQLKRIEDKLDRILMMRPGV